MAAFGIASQVLQIVPASSKAEVPSGLSTREADQDFSNQLEHAMERREEALDKAAARAEAREPADTNYDATQRGEGVSDAANREKRKEGATDDEVERSDNDPVTDGDEVTNEPTLTEGDTAPREDEGKQPAETAHASAKDDTGESVASDTTATQNGGQLNETMARNTVTDSLPAEGKTVVAATGTPSDGETVTATLKATDDTADQPATVSGGAGEIIEAGAAPTEVSTAPAAVPPTDQADAGAKETTPAEGAAAAAPGDELASAASGAMSGTGKGNGKPQKAAHATQTEEPKVVPTPKSDGDDNRPKAAPTSRSGHRPTAQDNGTVHVARAQQGDAGAPGSTRNNGAPPTTVPGNPQSDVQTTHPGLQNALASVSATQGEESNSALKLASLINSTSTSPSGDAGAPKAGPTPSAGGPQLQAPAAAVANLQALQNASSQASPLRTAPTPPPPPNPAAFQVAIHVARAIDDGLERINIRLHPANLGRVEVKLEVMQDGRVTATVIADKADTLDMLQRDSRALERALQDAGLHTDSESLNFGLRGEQDNGKADESGEGDQQANGQNDDGVEGIDVHGVIPPSRPLSAQAGALDIFV